MTKLIVAFRSFAKRAEKLDYQSDTVKNDSMAVSAGSK
jgi:hypothetical protein